MKAPVYRIAQQDNFLDLERPIFVAHDADGILLVQNAGDGKGIPIALPISRRVNGSWELHAQYMSNDTVGGWLLVGDEHTLRTHVHKLKNFKSGEKLAITLDDVNGSVRVRVPCIYVIGSFANCLAALLILRPLLVPIKVYVTDNTFLGILKRINDNDLDKLFQTDSKLVTRLDKKPLTYDHGSVVIDMSTAKTSVSRSTHTVININKKTDICTLLRKLEFVDNWLRSTQGLRDELLKTELSRPQSPEKCQDKLQQLITSFRPTIPTLTVRNYRKSYASNAPPSACIVVQWNGSPATVPNDDMLQTEMTRLSEEINKSLATQDLVNNDDTLHNRIPRNNPPSTKQDLILVGTGRYNDTNYCFAYLKSNSGNKIQPYSQAAQTFLTSKYLMYALCTSLLGKVSSSYWKDIIIKAHVPELLPTSDDDFKIPDVTNEFKNVYKSTFNLELTNVTLLEWLSLTEKINNNIPIEK